MAEELKKSKRIKSRRIYPDGSRLWAYCVRNVNAALVMDGGRPSPRMISCHNFLVITATIPPLWTTNLYRVYRSKTRLAMIGRRLIGVPVNINGTHRLAYGDDERFSIAEDISHPSRPPVPGVGIIPITFSIGRATGTNRVLPKQIVRWIAWEIQRHENVFNGHECPKTNLSNLLTLTVLLMRRHRSFENNRSIAFSWFTS